MSDYCNLKEYSEHAWAWCDDTTGIRVRPIFDSELVAHEYVEIAIRSGDCHHYVLDDDIRLVAISAWEDIHKAAKRNVNNMQLENPEI